MHDKVNSDDDLPSRLAHQKDLASKSEELQTLTTHYKGLLAREQRYKKEILSLQRRVKHEGKLHEQRVKNTLAFQLGTVILRATNSISGLLALPGALWEIRAEARRRAARRASKREDGLGLRPLTEQSTHRPIPPSATVNALSPNAVGRRLKVAAVMDEFTFHSYDPECELLQ